MSRWESWITFLFLAWILPEAGRGQYYEMPSPNNVTNTASTFVQPKSEPWIESALVGLPLIGHSNRKHTYDFQEIQITELLFKDRKSAFSGFTMLQKPGNKPFLNRPDSVVTPEGMLVWRGTRLLICKAPKFHQIRMGHFLEGWLDKQYPLETLVIPAAYQRLPLGSDLQERRYLLRDEQIASLWPGMPAEKLGLSRGNQLSIAGYRFQGRLFWAGWLDSPSRIEWKSTEWLGETTGMIAIGVPEDQRLAVLMGPPDTAWRMAMLTRLRNAWRDGEKGGSLDTSRFFRREYTYGDVIIAGFKMVFLCVISAIVVGCCVGWIVVFWKEKIRHRHGLDENRVAFIDLAGVTGIPPQTPKTSSEHDSGAASPSCKPPNRDLQE